MKAKLNRGGNIKLGQLIGTFSKLMGDDNYFIPELQTYVRGTCGKHCDGCKGSCYVTKSYRRYTERDTGKCSVKLGHARNTIAVRENIEQVFADLTGQIRRARKPFVIVRIHQSGELETVTEFKMWCNIAREFPNIVFYIYTKAFELVIPALLAGDVPKNLVVLMSIWHEYGIKEFDAVKHLDNVKAFVYCDGYNYTKHGLTIQTMCTAYNEHGKMNHAVTCDKCRKCFNSLESCKVIGCYDH